MVTLTTGVSRSAYAVYRRSFAENPDIILQEFSSSITPLAFFLTPAADLFATVLNAHICLVQTEADAVRICGSPLASCCGLHWW